MIDNQSISKILKIKEDQLEHIDCEYNAVIDVVRSIMDDLATKKKSKAITVNNDVEEGLDLIMRYTNVGLHSMLMNIKAMKLVYDALDLKCNSYPYIDALYSIEEKNLPEDKEE